MHLKWMLVGTWGLDITKARFEYGIFLSVKNLFKVKTNEHTNRLYGRIDEGYYTLNSKEGYSVWLQDISITKNI